MSDLDDRLVAALEEPGKDFVSGIRDNKITLWALVVITCLAFTASYFFYNTKAKREKDFLSFTLLKDQKETLDEDAIEQIKPYAKRYPELKAQIEHLIAYSLTLDKNYKAALPMVERSLSLDTPLAPYYKKFSKTSFLIENQKLGHALHISLELKDKMLNDHMLWVHNCMRDDYSAQLYLFNLLRIAALYRELGKVSEEREALKDLRQIIEKDESFAYRLPEKAIMQFQSHLSYGRVSLLNFIEARESVLAQQGA